MEACFQISLSPFWLQEGLGCAKGGSQKAGLALNSCARGRGPSTALSEAPTGWKTLQDPHLRPDLGNLQQQALEVQKRPCQSGYVFNIKLGLQTHPLPQEISSQMVIL